MVHGWAERARAPMGNRRVAESISRDAITGEPRSFWTPTSLANLRMLQAFSGAPVAADERCDLVSGFGTPKYLGGSGARVEE